MDGNLVTNGVWTFTWDAENRLAAVWSNSVLVVSNAYDHAHRRVLKVTSDATHTYHVPNVVVVSLGNMDFLVQRGLSELLNNAHDFSDDFANQNWFGWTNDADNYGAGTGYKPVWVWNSIATGQGSASLQSINQALGKPYVAIWGHFGHGQGGDIKLGDGPAVSRYPASQFQSHHRLALVFLYICQGARGNWWHLVSPSGELRANWYSINGGRAWPSPDPEMNVEWNDWYDLPLVERPQSPSP